MNLNTKYTKSDLFVTTSAKYMSGLGKTINETAISWDPYMEYDKLYLLDYVLFMNSENIFLSQKLEARILQSRIATLTRKWAIPHHQNV